MQLGYLTRCIPDATKYLYGMVQKTDLKSFPQHYNVFHQHPMPHAASKHKRNTIPLQRAQFHFIIAYGRRRWLFLHNPRRGYIGWMPFILYSCLCLDINLKLLHLHLKCVRPFVNGTVLLTSTSYLTLLSTAFSIAIRITRSSKWQTTRWWCIWYWHVAC